MIRSAGTLAGLIALACVAAPPFAAGADGPAARWQCAPTGAGAPAPALAEATRDYLTRVEALYPNLVLGLVRAGARFYLVNAVDIGWGERNRLHLLALRLRETYRTVEERAMNAAPGSAPPPGNFVCLAAARAEREGLTRTPGGEVMLAAGHTVHLVDPQEPRVAIEVGAAPDLPLNLGGILHRSARTGIYAGLTGHGSAGGIRRSDGAAKYAAVDGSVVLRLADAGESAAETRVATPGPAPEPAPAAAPAGMAAVPVAVEAPVVAVMPSASAQARPAPVAAGATIRDGLSAAARPLPAAEQTYEEYAQAMKTLMALRRPGAVRSVSELTYVHPAVEYLRARGR